MKTRKQITNEITKNKNKIEALTAELENIEKKAEIRREAQAGNYNRCKELHDEARAHADKITELCNEIYILKIVGWILAENLRSATVAEALPVIAGIVEPYNGKPYGEKTREKLWKAARDRGFAFYFEGYSSKDYLKVAALDANGCCYGRDYMTIYTSYETPFIDKDNKLQFNLFKLRNNYKYIENPRSHAKKIIKAYEEYKKTTAKAYAAQSAFNSLLPSEGISRQNEVTREPYATFI